MKWMLVIIVMVSKGATGGADVETISIPAFASQAECESESRWYEQAIVETWPSRDSAIGVMSRCHMIDGR